MINANLSYLQPELKNKRAHYLFPTLKQLYTNPPHFVRGSNQYLYDDKGRSYLDMYAGIATVSLGHCREEVLSAMTEQMHKLQHTSTILLTQAVIDLAEKLAAIAPGELKTSYLMNSGSEATEFAVMVARAVTRRWQVIALKHSYHGQSGLWMPPDPKSRIKENKLGPGIILAENYYCYRCPFGLKRNSCHIECALSLETLIEEQDNTPAAFIAEPIQGFGGCIVAPGGYFEKVSEICQKHGMLFICDEVQTGLGRTGSMFGIDHFDCTPNIMTLGKALGNGQPVSACITSERIAAAMDGAFISTFGGNAVSCAASLAVINVIEQEQLADNARKIGAYLQTGLKELAKSYPFLADIRGMGLMIGIEVADAAEKKPLPDLTQRIVESCKDNGVIIGRGGWFENVLRIKPPLTITYTDADRCLSVLEKSLHEFP